MEEVFHEQAQRHGQRKAKLLYTIEVLKLLRPILLKNFEGTRQLNQFGMFKNYFKVSLRGLMKSPVNSFINIFGLAVAIGICVFGYGFARWTFSTDQFHEHKNNVYLVTFFADREGKPQQHGKTPRPLGEMLRDDFAHIKKVSRVEDRSVVMKHKNNVFYEQVRYVDSEFLDMFTFPLKWGTAQSLRDVNSIVISDAMAKKYFGDENPINQDITMIVGNELNKVFKVTGVAAEFPKSLSFSFNFLINFQNFRTTEPSYNFHDWNKMVDATFIQVDDVTHLSEIANGMGKYQSIQNKAVDEDWAITSFGFEPLATLHKQSEHIKDSISRSSKSNYVSIMFMGGIAFFMLLLACFNYINIAIVTATRRLKEIGVRKSIGATRKVVITQFLIENIVITFFAMIVGVALGYSFFIRGFEQLWSFNMDFTLKDSTLWIFLPAILLITSVASGFYPALYISRFQVVNILKGSVMFGKKNPMTKIFLGFQLIMASMFITTSVMFTQNTSYLKARPWGYDNRELLYANVSDQSSFEKLSNAMAQSPDIMMTSGAVHHVGKSHASTTVHFPDRDYEVDQLSVDAHYFESMGIPLTDGRTFQDHEGSDQQSIVVNETFVRNMMWDSPIGESLKIDSVQYEVIGVVQDFHSYNFAKDVRSIAFRLADKEDYRFLVMRVRNGKLYEAHNGLRQNWAKLFPEIPFSGGYQEDIWGLYYEQLNIYDLVWKVFAFLAIVVATLGLYGLVKLNVEGRTKEFSIRKILGADGKNIAGSVTRPYMILFTLALAVGAPLGYVFATWTITFAYTYHMPITISGVTISMLLMVMVLLITISTQILKVVKSNPVDGLRIE